MSTTKSTYTTFHATHRMIHSSDEKYLLSGHAVDSEQLIDF
jgi:hypothetical protein